MKRFAYKMHLITWTTTEDPPAGGALEQLVPACRRGERSAQRRMFEALAPKMMALCLRYTGDRPTAEDVLQDGFVTLFSRLDSYSGAGSFEGWARRIFVNTALMHL
jgi:RNA polymerase sigma-70 factor (ECF subfamily)